MRICVISTPVFQLPCAGYSGLEHLAWLTAKGLAERGESVALVAPDGSACPGVDIIECGPAGHFDEKTAYDRYWKYLPSFDAIVDESWQKHAYILKMEGHLPQPVLGVMHAPVATMYGQLPPVPKPCMVCISNDQAESFRTIHPGHDVRTCYNGVDPLIYRPMSIPRSDRYLFLARFSTIKGPDLAIKACLEAGVGLDLVGDTSITNEPDYLRHCMSMCDGEQIRFVGPATRGECVWWFSQAKALLHPNERFREPFGLAPVEAMLCGCPVIAWDHGAMRETINPGVSGYLARSLEQMVNLIKNDAVEKLIDRNRCRKHAMQFSESCMIDRYLELCHEAVETGGW